MITDRVRIIKHEAVPGCGSFEVRVIGKPSVYFYWDNIPASPNPRQHQHLRRPL